MKWCMRLLLLRYRFAEFPAARRLAVLVDADRLLVAVGAGLFGLSLALGFAVGVAARLLALPAQPRRLIVVRDRDVEAVAARAVRVSRAHRSLRFFLSRSTNRRK